MENGAAVHGADGAALEILGLPYDEVRRRLATAAARLGVTLRGFGDMPAGPRGVAGSQLGLTRRIPRSSVRSRPWSTYSRPSST